MEAETDVGSEAEARAEERVAVVDEEEVRGGGSCASGLARIPVTVSCG